LVLDCLADADMPLEAVYRAYSDGDSSIDPAETLEDLIKLHRLGLVCFRQEPIRPLGQEFDSRQIEPDTPEDILGDCREEFEEFRRRRDYLWSLDLGGGAGGVPFGIWVERTTRGQEEWDRPVYEVYYPAPDA
jgi:hypothetical protein